MAFAAPDADGYRNAVALAQAVAGLDSGANPFGGSRIESRFARGWNIRHDRFIGLARAEARCVERAGYRWGSAICRR